MAKAKNLNTPIPSRRAVLVGPHLPRQPFRLSGPDLGGAAITGHSRFQKSKSSMSEPR
jgi:hypothetical protein